MYIGFLVLIITFKAKHQTDKTLLDSWKCRLWNTHTLLLDLVLQVVILSLCTDDRWPPCPAVLFLALQFMWRSRSYGPADKINFAVKNTTKNLLHITHWTQHRYRIRLAREAGLSQNEFYMCVRLSIYVSVCFVVSGNRNRFCCIVRTTLSNISTWQRH